MNPPTEIEAQGRAGLLAAWLAAYLAATNESYASFARRAGLTTPGVRFIAIGKVKSPGRPTLQKIAAAADAEVVDLIALRPKVASRVVRGKQNAEHRWEGHEDGEWRTCRCGERRFVLPSSARSWRAHSRSCAAAGMRRLGAWNALQTRCLAELQVKSLTFNGFARGAGINPPGLRRWFRVKDSTTSGATLERLAVALRIPFDKALKEAGGKTRDEVWAEAGTRGAAALTSLTPEKIVERSRRSSESRRGQKRGAGVWEKIAEGRRRTGANERSRAGLAADAQSLSGRARRALFARLQAAPSPTRKQRENWASEVASRLQVRATAVLAIWQPYLQARGLVHAGGRHRMDSRYALVNEIRQSWPRVGASQRLAAGVWEAAAKRVSADENSAIDAGALKIWFLLYKGRLMAETD